MRSLTNSEPYYRCKRLKRGVCAADSAADEPEELSSASDEDAAAPHELAEASQADQAAAEELPSPPAARPETLVDDFALKEASPAWAREETPFFTPQACTLAPGYSHLWL